MNIQKSRNIADRTCSLESYIFNLESNEIFILKDTSSVIWEHIPDNENIDIDKLSEILLDIYDIDKTYLKNDILNLCNQLISEGILISPNKLINKKICTQERGELEIKKDKRNLESNIIDIMVKNNQPHSATIEITQKCNEKCVHCYAIKDSNKLCTGELTTEEIKRLIDNLANLGCIYLGFTGGEVFTRADFSEILEYARLRKFIVYVSTNGLLIREKNIKFLKKLYIRAFYLSVYSMSPVIHDGITGIMGSQEKTILAIHLLRREEIPVVINITTFSENPDEYIAVAEFAESIGAEWRISNTITAKSDGNNKTLKYRLVDKQKIFEILDFTSFDGQKGSIQPFDENESVCAAGKSSLTISATGEVYPCLTLRTSFGNIRENELDEIWHNSKLRKKITSIKWKDRKSCLSCPHKEYCEPCMGASYLEHGNILSGNYDDCFNSKCKNEFFNRT